MKELLIRQKLDSVDDLVVEKAVKVVENTGIATQMQPKQLRNVIAVALDTESVAVVDNFIKYQIGRRDEWRYNNFGESVCADLNKLRERANSLANTHVTARDLEIHLARRYLGYMIRHFEYVQSQTRQRKGG